MTQSTPPQRGTQAKVTLADVATLARVDRSVVSRVINGDPRLNVRPETRQRVLDTVEKLGYRPNAAARSLRTARAYMYGLFIPDFANPVYAEIIKGAEAAAGRLGFGLMTASSVGVGLGVEHYADLLAQGRVDGMLFAGEESGRELERLRDRRIPWLLVNRRVEGSDRYVILDDEDGSKRAVEHLVSLGHVRIGHVAGPEIADTARRRKAGYVAAMTRAGLDPDPRLVVHADYTPTGGAEAMTALLAVDPPPTAVFVANAASAVGCLHAAHLQGFTVPRDVSVVAVHDMAFASHLTPALTTVRMPLEQLGRRALEVLASHGPDEPIREVVTEPVEMLVRDSTAPPRPS
ncbi:MAG: LacI family DNA-binding transcriptional regulator [Streptosporangiales bacterium]|nr:LacI family DNA-binding transcriptional regulator [Streptosporangiales bacterium]